MPLTASFSGFVLFHSLEIPGGIKEEIGAIVVGEYKMP